MVKYTQIYIFYENHTGHGTFFTTTNKFLPTLLDSIVTEHDHKMYSLPTLFGGMGIPILTEIANENFEDSKKKLQPN